MYACQNQIRRKRKSPGPNTRRGKGKSHDSRKGSPSKAVAECGRARGEANRCPGPGQDEKSGDEVLLAGLATVGKKSVGFWPGSLAARFMGCRCPMIENKYGAGFIPKREIYCFAIDCPMHGGFGTEPHIV